MRILYATDGSAGANEAGRLLARLPLTPNDTVVVLAVTADDPERCFSASVTALEGCSATVERMAQHGNPGEQILETAREREADLIVMGAMGHGGLARFFLGSVSERVLRHAETNVLIGRPIRHNLQRVIVGVAGSLTSPQVVQAAGAFPLPSDRELALLTVLPPTEATSSVAPMVWASLAGEMERVLHDAMEQAEDLIRELAHPLQEAGRPVTGGVLRGEPATALIHAAETQEADMLVVGRHGEGGLNHFLLGSVSERVARHAPCSVLVVRTVLPTDHSKTTSA